MSIKLQQLKHFVFVVEEGGFRTAANRANRSQAALSTSIKELEKILGQPLFETGNKSTLTPFGEICLPKIIQFLNVYKALDNAMKNGIHALALHLYNEQEWKDKTEGAPVSPNCMGGSKGENL